MIKYLVNRILKIWHYLIRLGVQDGMDIILTERVKTSNSFALMCVFFAFPYIVYSLVISDYVFATNLSTWWILFIYSIQLNKKKKYLMSRNILCFTTNYAVFVSSLCWGFDSGLCFYYFATPAIVFFLFNQDERVIKIIFMLIYISSPIILYVLSHTVLNYPLSVAFSQSQLHNIRIINFIGSFALLVFLINHFSNLSYLVNQNYKIKNDELNNEVALKNKAREEIESLFVEQQVMMSEMHHRVKNNLAVISGLLDIQILKIEDEKVKNDLKETQLRIFSISYVHEKLYRLNSYSNIDFGEFVKEFGQMLLISLSKPSKPIKLDTEVSIHNFDLMQSIPLTMLINELIINSIKHAFVNTNEGIINIDIKQCPNSKVIYLTYSDNGIGFETDLTVRKSSSMGLNIIQSIIKQLKGKANFTKCNGTIFNLEFNT